MTTEGGPRDKIAAQLRDAAADAQHVADTTDAQPYMDQLVALLTKFGLRVAAKLPALSVKDPAVSAQDPRGQQVVIRNYEGLGLTWCWVWPALRAAMFGEPTPPPEVEPMCPAEEVERAARLIVNVVRLRDPHIAVGIDDTEHPSGCTCRKGTDVRS